MRGGLWRRDSLPRLREVRRPARRRIGLPFQVLRSLLAGGGFPERLAEVEQLRVLVVRLTAREPAHQLSSRHRTNEATGRLASGFRRGLPSTLLGNELFSLGSSCGEPA